MRWRGWFVVSGVVVVLVLAVWVARSRFRPDPAAASLKPTPFLREVVEPITIVDSMAFADGGSEGLRFADARGKARDICLEDSLSGQPNLVLDSFLPDGERARRVPIAGVEERALLGLLERWARQDPDARELERRHALYEDGKLSIDAFWKGLPERDRVKGVALNILRRLRERN